MRFSDSLVYALANLQMAYIETSLHVRSTSTCVDEPENTSASKTTPLTSRDDMFNIAPPRNYVRQRSSKEKEGSLIIIRKL